MFDKGASRRQFFKLLAASPLLGLAGSGLPTNWQAALAREAERRAATPVPSSLQCRGCGIEMPLAPTSESHVNLAQAPEGQMRDAINEQFTGQMIESVDDAVNVWDFERVLTQITYRNTGITYTWVSTTSKPAVPIGRASTD